MSDELESKKPKATLIKHPKADCTRAVLEPDGEKKKAVVVVKKKAVVKKVVVAHRPEGGRRHSRSPSSEPKPAPASGSSETRLTPEQLKAFAAKRPQEMRQVAPADRPKPEGLRIETRPSSP